MNRPTFLATGVLMNLYVELVPSKNWRERAKEAAFASMFFSIKGDLVVGDQVIRAEYNVQATNEKGEILQLGIERESRAGETYVVLANEPNGNAAALSQELGPDGRLVPMIQEGEPVILDTTPLPATWSPFHVCKMRVNVRGDKGLELTNIRISYDDATTQSGHACAKIMADGGYTIVDAGTRVVAAGPVATFGKVGVSAAYAARKSAASTPANIN